MTDPAGTSIDAQLMRSVTQLAESRAETAASREETAASLAHIANLEAALRSSRRIGMAMGILMAERRITERAAFTALTNVSQHQNRKLRDVADEVVLTGHLQDVS